MKLLRIALCFYLLLVGVLVISQPGAVLAQDATTNEEQEIEEEVKISAKHPKVEIIAGESAEFEVELLYLSNLEESEPRIFDLLATGPKDWYFQITPQYPKEKKIASIELKPGFAVGEKIIVSAFLAPWLIPEPGEYPITLEVTSGDLKGTYELTVKVTARYSLSLFPATERYNTSATAGKDNYFSIEVWNGGTAAVDNITFSSDKPRDWTIEFPVQKIDSLDPVDSETIDVNIKPPARTIAGDYTITLKASGKQATATELDIRVTVETPTIWGWVGVGIIVLVIAGVAFIFMRFSRR